MAFDTLQIKAVEGLLSFKNENDLFPPGGTPIWNRRECSLEILNLTPKGDQSGRGLSKFWQETV